MTAVHVVVAAVDTASGLSLEKDSVEDDDISDDAVNEEQPQEWEGDDEPLRAEHREEQDGALNETDVDDM